MHTISEKENAYRAIKMSGDCEWVPLAEDCMDTIFPSAMHECPPAKQDGDDWFGCSWCWDDACFGHAPNVKKKYILEDITEWRSVVKFPDLDKIDFKAAAEKDLDRINRDKFVRLFFEKGPFERVSILMGFEEAFVAMQTEPEEYKALIDALADWKIDLLNRLIDVYHPDEILAHDDLGTSHGPMISPQTYQELIQPAHQKMINAVHAKNVLFTHHTCGKIEPFLDLFIENGIDMLNPVQYVNDWDFVAEKCKGKLALNVNLSNRGNRFGATEQEVREDVERGFNIFAKNKNVIFESRLSNKRVPEMQKFCTEYARSLCDKEKF